MPGEEGYIKHESKHYDEEERAIKKHTDHKPQKHKKYGIILPGDEDYKKPQHKKPHKSRNQNQRPHLKPGIHIPDVFNTFSASFKQVYDLFSLWILKTER